MISEKGPGAKPTAGLPMSAKFLESEVLSKKIMVGMSPLYIA
jgi:hypothetical protein